MSSPNLKKPPANGTTGRVSPASSSTQGSPTASRTPSRTAAGAGVARSTSVRATGNGTPVSARAAVKKPGASSSSSTTGPKGTRDGGDDDAKAEAAALMEDLKLRLQKAEEAEEEYQKQVEVLQLRLDEALKEQGKLEERLQEEDERIEGLENERQESVRQKRELEAIYEAERAAVMKDKEVTLGREEELQGIIQRLKESLSDRELRPGSDDGRLSRNPSSPSLDTNNFAPSSALSRSDSRNNSKLIMQKDKMIESLRLELAEAQIKLVEMENLGGGRLQELERTLLETRMANARLMEDNDSYQLLLSEKTLNGDFARNDIMQANTSAPNAQTPPRPSAGASLADELSTISITDSEGGEDSETAKRLEAEISALKDQNKALTLYISKIIERILEHQGGFEHILSHTEDQPGRPNPPNKDKDLPPPPKDSTPPQPSFLERARSAVGAANKQKPQPQPRTQFTSPSFPTPSITDDPTTAPSIPLARASTMRSGAGGAPLDRRRTVDWSAAAVVTNMYRGPANPDATPASPGLASQRNSFFAFTGPARTPSGTAVPTTSTAASLENADPAADASGKSARDAALDALEGGSASGTGSAPASNPSSPPRSTASKEERPSVMTGSKMRPLRLVQEAAEENDAARKAANRASWFQPSGWFNREGGAAAP